MQSEYTGRRTPGTHYATETYQVAYLIEPEMKTELETDILQSLRMQVDRA